MSDQKLFLSDVDGHLYKGDDFANPFRKGLKYWTKDIRTVRDLKAVIRASDGAYGGYSLVLFTDDGGTLCEKCARTEFREIAGAISEKNGSGWRAIGAAMSCDLEACDCDNCNATIVAEDDLND